MIPSAPVVQMEHVRHVFTSVDGSRFVAVDDLTLEVREGEIVSIVGKTGCGKSTMFNLLLGLENPTAGSITVLGRDPYQDFDFFRAKFGVIFQTDRLLPWRTAFANAKVGLEILGYSEAEQGEIARHWLHKLELMGFEDAYPHELSGGMRQRVGIARAFCLSPDVFFADEAFGHLDQSTAQRLREVFLTLIGETKKTCLLITHNIHEALEIGSRLIVLGKPSRVLYDVQCPTRASRAELVEFEERILDIIERNEPHHEAAARARS
ncbi:MAG: ATP-binding cassette domain-containing protein [Candidatus Tectomicrobia bacterium]|nr:ATP-binding cassette domain-containing protein [Candidatus Tectomicrobia bacterium]